MHKKILENELEGFGIRLNKEPPNIHFKRKEKGGINLQIMVNSTYENTMLWKKLIVQIHFTSQIIVN